MKNFIILTESINYIEENICEEIAREDIAKHCYVSLSALEKLFRYALHLSIKEYILKRRMTQAAKDILNKEISITQIAMKYQFNSVEVFSRAFKRVWFVNPSEFKSKWKFSGIFPKINYEYREGEKIYMGIKKVDMSEMYDYLKNLKGSYVLCFDGIQFKNFNDVSRKLGDYALVSIAQRIDKVATDDMILMRIGGDEFALLTGLCDYEEAKKLSQQVISHNGEPLEFEGNKYPLALWCGITQIPNNLRYSDFFTNMQDVIESAKIK